VAVIFFSSGLARYTGGVDSMTVDAPRVADLLKAVIERFPDLEKPLEIMTVAVDGEIHHQPDYLALTPASEVHLVPRISGGATTTVGSG
jgi:molybdopterin converting factor small subunit